MKLGWKRLWLFAGILTMANQLCADLTLEVDLGGTQTRISMSVLKKRVDTVNPLLGAPTSVLIQVENGTVCKVDPGLKVYEEKFFEISGDGSSTPSGVPGGASTVKPLNKTRAILGLQASGYQASLPDGRTVTLWVAPINETLMQAGREIYDYQKAYLGKLYENQPSKQPRDLDEDLCVVAGFIQPDLAAMLHGLRGLPKGFLLAMEARDEKKRFSVEEKLLEIKSLQAAPVRLDTFVIPQTYKQVPSLMEEQIRGMRGTEKK